MHRLRTTLIAVAALAVLAPAAADAAGGGPRKARFTATFEAERKVAWSQPRGVSLIDCNGQHYLSAFGSDTFRLKTRRPQLVEVTDPGVKGMTLWTYPGGTPSLPKLGLDVAGMHARDYTEIAGTTGGWCSAAESLPKPESDCGTRLPSLAVRLSTIAGAALWSHVSQPTQRNEKLGFDTCPLIVPRDVTGSEFPTVTRKVRVADLFNRRKRTLTISGAKTFGPESTGVPNYGVERTTKATVTWTLKLTRR